MQGSQGYLLEDRVRYAQLAQVEVLLKLVQIVNVHHLPAKLHADGRLQHLPYYADEVRRVHEVQGFQVLLIFPVECLVGPPEPRKGRLVLASQTTVEVNDAVVLLYVFVQREHQVPETRRLSR